MRKLFESMRKVILIIRAGTNGWSEKEERGELTKLGELQFAVPEAAASRTCTGAGETKRRPADRYHACRCRSRAAASSQNTLMIQ